MKTDLRNELKVVKNNNNMITKYIFLIYCIVMLISCTKKSTIFNPYLHVKVDSFLQNKMSEINAISGQAIIMDIKTGNIKTMVGNSNKQPSALIRPISILAALETGKVKLSDTIDVENGIYLVNNDTLKDHNWHRGGYGKITLEQGIMVGSNIATYKAVEKAFDNEQAYYDQMSDSITYIDKNLMHNSIGYGLEVTPLQLLYIYNDAIKNDSLKVAFRKTVTEGLGKQANSDKVQVAGVPATTIINDSIYAVEFVGCFPADEPKYSIIVSMNKKGLPASGGLMAGSVLKEIVDCMNK